MNIKELRWLLEYAIFRVLTCLIGIVSVKQSVQFAKFLGWSFVHLLPRKWTRYEVAASNLKTAFPDFSERDVEVTIEKMWVHLFRLVAETVQFPRKLHLENYREIMSFRNRGEAAQALNSGRPVFMLSGHFGNWEATTATFGTFGFPMGIVARKLDNPYLHRWFVRTREVTGHRLLLKSGGWDGITDLLSARGNLGLLCDQDAGRRGVFVDFFGKPASTFRSIALMAIENDAIVLLGYGVRQPDNFDECRWVQYEVGCEIVIDTKTIQSDDEVRSITEQYSQALEAAVRRYPEQYFWVHRRWKSIPRKKKTNKEKAA